MSPPAGSGAGEEHWFEGVAAHLGSAYLRYSFTKGTEQEVAFLVGHLGLGAGDEVLDVGCGPGRHAIALARLGVRVTGVDISATFVEVAQRAAEEAGVADLVTFERGDARRLDHDGRFDVAIALCQGAFGLQGGPAAVAGDLRGGDASVLSGMARAVRPGGAVVVSAFSAYFQVRHLEDVASFDAATGTNHERTVVKDPAGNDAEAELWTTCYTPGRAPPGGRAGRPAPRGGPLRRTGAVRRADTDRRDRRVPARGPPPRLSSAQAVAPRRAERTRSSGRHYTHRASVHRTKPVSLTDTTITESAFGTFTEAGDYIPRTIVEDDLGGMSFEDAIANTIVEFDDGDVVHGTVVRVDKDEVLLDIGYKSEGVIPSKELSIRNDVDPSEIVSLGDEIEALVLQKEDADGRLILSKKRAQYERAWGRIEEIKESDGVVKGPVIEVVKGGLIVDIGLRGFLPASLVELRRVRDLEPYVGQEIEAKIIELDKNRNNVVLSRRAWLEEAQREQREAFLDGLQPGQRRNGTVSSVVSFGAFVDLGGMDGLIHVSELSWKHVDHPGAVVQVGDDVFVEVLEVDRDRERISLSLKATQQDPWQEFASGHQVGELVYGRVAKLVPFGAFVQVGDGIEGLVHISEMSAHHVDLPEQVVTPGEELWVKIIDLDLDRRRISLSIKQAAEGGVVAAEYQEAFGDHAYDDQGNYVGYNDTDYADEARKAWAEYYEKYGDEAYRAAVEQYGHGPDPGGVLGEDGGDGRRRDAGAGDAVVGTPLR